MFEEMALRNHTILMPQGQLMRNEKDTANISYKHHFMKWH